MQKVTAVSEPRACQLVGVSRSTLHYEPRRTEEEQQLRSKIVEIALKRQRCGYRRIHALLRRDGVKVNHKPVCRLYREASLAVKRRKRRKGVAVPRGPLSLPAQRNEVWSMDFVIDALSHGRRIKILTIVDDCTKEAVDLVADFGISGALRDPCA
jgi:putative transposase